MIFRKKRSKKLLSEKKKNYHVLSGFSSNYIFSENESVKKNISDLVRLFDLRLFGFVCFLFLLESGKDCGL